jgi:hypothetical protein
MRFRASGIAPLFLGSDGLTDVQERDLEALVVRFRSWRDETDEKLKAKFKLTDIMMAKLEDLKEAKQQFISGNVELSKGAQTFIKDVVRQRIMKFSAPFGGNKYTEKGNQCEDMAIELYNSIFFKDYKKLVEGDEFYELSYGLVGGHPDIVDVDNRKVIDIKVPWSKDTFPDFEEDGESDLYKWQIRTYLYILRKMTGDNTWSDGEIAYMLIDTPEALVPENDGDDLHMMSDLPNNLRSTIVTVTLTDEHVEHMDRRVAAAIKFADKYKQRLLNKNTNV